MIPNKLIKIADAILAGARMNFENSDSLIPIMFVLEKNKPLLPVVMIPQTEEIKRGVMAGLIGMIRAEVLEAYFHVSEIWTVECKDDEERCQVERWRSKHGTLEGAPGVVERVHLLLGCAKGIAMWHATITTKDEKRVLEPWERLSDLKDGETITMGAGDALFINLWTKARHGQN